ncbi:hypothetical protein ES705_29035 [subsurface metagenome]
MKSADVIPILEDLSRNSEHALDITQVHALTFACAVIHSLPEASIKVIDVLFDLAYPEPKI